MDEQKIKEAAYALWEKDGRPDGHDLEHWFKASSTVDGEISNPDDSSLRTTNQTSSNYPTSDTSEGSSNTNSRNRKNAKI